MIKWDQPAPNTSGGGLYDHSRLKNLWIQAGGDPKDADLMAHVALAESSGDPSQHNSYTQNGRTYTVRGLWQISDINGPGNYADPLEGARKAVELHRTQGLRPWEDSRTKGNGGGWGQYVNRAGGVRWDSSGGGAGAVRWDDAKKPPTAPQKRPIAQAGLVPNLPPPKTIAHAVVGQESRLSRNVDWIRQHPVEALGDALGTLQRGVAGAVLATDQHKGLRDTLSEVWHDVWHADQKNQDRLTTALENSAHLPTHEAIDAYVNRHVPQQLRPYVGALLKGGEDFAIQTASDPLTYVGVGDVVRLLKLPELARGIHATLHGQQVAQALHNAIQAFPALQRFTPQFDAIAAAYQKMGEAYGALFHVRPELDQTFESEGKHHFMQIETRHYNIAQANRSLDEAPFHLQRSAEVLDKRIARAKKYVASAPHPVNAQAHQAYVDALVNKRNALDPALKKASNDIGGRYLRYVYDHGEQQKSNVAAHLLGLPVKGSSGVLVHSGDVRTGLVDFLQKSAENQEKALQKMRTDVQHGSTAKDAEDFFSQQPQHLKAKIGDWDKYVRDLAKQNAQPIFNPKNPAAKKIAQVAQASRGLMQATLFIDPLPHGLKNVGVLAYFAGGLRVVPEALYTMMRGGVDAATRERLVRIGAGRPSYTTHGVNPTIWSHVIPGFDKVAGKLQDSMSVMEEAWRAALLKKLDRQMGLGKNPTQAEELAKGYIINQRLGDYRNQPQLVKMFEAFGGPWVAFRLGIVPKNVLQTIYENPGRVLAIIRAQEDIQHNRSKLGQRMNEISFGGPVEDFSRMVSDPLKYLESPSTLGGIGEVLQSQRESDYAGPIERVGGALHSINPVAQLSDPIINALQGHELPGPSAPHGRQIYQHASLADALILSTLRAIAVQVYKQQGTGRALKAQKAREKSISTRDLQYLKQLLTLPWEPPAGGP